MVVNMSKMASFVIGKMVIVLLIENLSHETVLCLFVSDLFLFSGRGVDLNRNWSVDWGKKENVSVSVFPWLCTGKIKFLLIQLLY
jgi:hypothetical protein